MGALFALSLFMIEMGAAQIILTHDQACRAERALSPHGLLPADACLSDAQRDLVRVFSVGVDAPSREVSSALRSRIITALVYGVAGGLAAQFSARTAAGLFAAFHVVFTGGLFVLTYLSTFVVG
jgi:hypothetical protein